MPLHTTPTRNSPGPSSTAQANNQSAFHEEVVHLRFGHITIRTATLVWRVWHPPRDAVFTPTMERELRCASRAASDGFGSRALTFGPLLHGTGTRRKTTSLCWILQSSHIDTSHDAQQLAAASGRCRVPPIPSCTRPCFFDRTSVPSPTPPLLPCVVSRLPHAIGNRTGRDSPT